MGRPLLIGEEADRQLQESACYFRDCESPVNASVVIATAESILTSIDANVFASNGGGISLSKDWAKVCSF